MDLTKDARHADLRDLRAAYTAFRRMFEKPRPYGFIDIGHMRVGLLSQSGLYPPVDLVFSSLAEMRELANTLTGIARAEERKRQTRRSLKRKPTYPKGEPRKRGRCPVCHLDVILRPNGLVQGHRCLDGYTSGVAPEEV